MIKNIGKAFIVFLIMLLLAFVICCDNNNNNNNTPTEQKGSIDLTSNSILYVGEEIEVSATLNQVDGDIIWTSSDEEKATVVNGVVKGISAGTVIIKAKVNDIEAEITIKVKEKVLEQNNLFCGLNVINEAIVHKKVELSLLEKESGYIKANYNTFDYNKIKAYGVFTSPDRSKQIVAPAFWYRDYEIKLDTNFSTGKNDDEPNGMEMVTWTGDYEYRIRFSPSMEGVWSYIIYSEVEGGTLTEELTGTIDVASSNEEYKGLIQIDKSNNRTFIYEDGTTFMPIGENMGWWADNSRKTYDYYVWFNNASKNDMNIARIWMAPWGFCLHWGSSYKDFTDRLNYAARLDKVLEYADDFDMYIMLTLLNHGQFSTTADSTWSENPYNVKKGGILEKPETFFVSAEAKTAYKNELLYIIARYGYSDKIMAWELFNEVDWTDNSSLNAVNIKSWHKEMAEYIKANDTYGHLVTTSYKTEYGTSFSLDVIDFACPHSYGYAGKNICDTLPDVLDKLYKQYKKPILHAEIGIDWQNGYNNYKLDPTGINLRQNSWAGMMGGGAGGAMNWWWDSYVHPYDLYYQFAGAGKYAKLMDLTGEDYTVLRTLDGVSKDNRVGLLGYKFDDRIYGYIYDVNWKYNNATGELEGVYVSIPFTNGNYELTIYNATNGREISKSVLQVTDGMAKINLPNFTSDIAFIIK